MTQLEQLPHPVYFVNPRTEKWRSLLSGDELPEDLEPLYEQCVLGDEVWSVQLYIHLKQRGLNVRLVDRFVPGKICVAPYHYLEIKKAPLQSYVVAVQTDSARPEICEQRMVFNEHLLLEPNDHLIYHLPHPMLQPRDRSRGTRLENLEFKGGICNIAQPFLTPTFSEELAHLGIQFKWSGEDSNHKVREWGDYRQTDAVIAVRNATFGDLRVKPAIKLINAWSAGCPAILGPEPAYQSLRRSELDFFEVRSPAEAITVLKRLKQNPTLYWDMVDNGLKRAQEFTTDQQAQLWQQLLSGAVAQGYEQWLQQSIWQKVVGRPTQFIQRSLEHKRQLKRYLYLRDHGNRLFADEPMTASPSLSLHPNQEGSPMIVR